jgi:nitrite reductase/ring-hydroxylating ferredoxin subunit/uncharacterized membrane protein
MEDTSLENSLKEVDSFASAAESVSRGIHSAVLQGGKPARQVADILHGTWLGHPLHPALTDFVVGAFAFASLFNLVGNGDPDNLASKMAQRLIKAGAITAVPTAMSGMADFSTIAKRSMATGALHGMLNSTALVLYLLALRRNGSNDRTASKVFTTLGFGTLFLSAWLGGKMTYKYGVGVNKAERPDGPKAWKDVLGEHELREKEPRRIEVDGSPVLLYREAGQIYAIGAVCAHESGPLEKGTVENGRVQCPWHQSVFDLRDGSVVHGPTTYPVPSYEARLREGRIELRLGQTQPREKEDSRQLAGGLAQQL